jgi:hypothetical protein
MDSPGFFFITGIDGCSSARNTWYVTGFDPLPYQNGWICAEIRKDMER